MRSLRKWGGEILCRTPARSIPCRIQRKQQSGVDTRGKIDLFFKSCNPHHFTQHSWLIASALDFSVSTFSHQNTVETLAVFENHLEVTVSVSLRPYKLDDIYSMLRTRSECQNAKKG